ncbi:hypothetical protein HYT74_01330 [Candidatus Daviesbacteria bacterium]|nr:hypothetical protein [Candidatus Daviesbacteria bacterium]
MIRLLPFILIPVIIVSGLGYWRYLAGKQGLQTPQKINSQVDQQVQAPVEVPKTLPAVSTAEPVPQVNNLKSPSPQVNISSSADSKIKDLESTIIDLKTRIAVLEKATPAPAVSSAKYPLYIPLGSGGGPWDNQNWESLAEYQISINTDNYSGYSSMQLEANFRLTEAAGIGSVRLYNITDNSAISSELSTTSTSFGSQTSATFKLPSGQKTYSIQIKSTQGKTLFVQSARIKVNF